MASVWQVDFQIFGNVDWTDAVPVLDQAGAPLTLAGASLRMVVKDKSGATKLDLTSTTGTLTIDTDDATLLRLAVPVAQIATLAPGEYRHDLVMTRDGAAMMLWFGALKVMPGVTPWQ